MRRRLVTLILLAAAPATCTRAGFLPRQPTDRRETDRGGSSPRDGRARDAAGQEISAPDLTGHTDGDGWIPIVKLVPSPTGCPAPWVFLAEPAGCGIDWPLSCVAATGNVGSVSFPIPGPYREIRGQVRGVQFKSTDGFRVNTSAPSLDNVYVEGVSITVGSPRQHLWTYAAGLLIQGIEPGNCPCAGGEPAPAFVGDRWRCDSGNPDPSYDHMVHNVWFLDHPLWDDDATGPACAALLGSGWFAVALDQPTSDPLEVRILFDGCDENVAITELALEVR